MPSIAFAQTKTMKVSGTVKDAQNEGLIGVNVLVRTSEGTFGGVSGSNGEYEVDFEAKDSVTVSYSYVGFQTYTFSVIANGNIKRDVILTDKRQRSVAAVQHDDTAAECQSDERQCWRCGQFEIGYIHRRAAG